MNYYALIKALQGMLGGGDDKTVPPRDATVTEESKAPPLIFPDKVDDSASLKGGGGNQSSSEKPKQKQKRKRRDEQAPVAEITPVEPVDEPKWSPSDGWSGGGQQPPPQQPPPTQPPPASNEPYGPPPPPPNWKSPSSSGGAGSTGGTGSTGSTGATGGQGSSAASGATAKGGSPGTTYVIDSIQQQFPRPSPEEFAQAMGLNKPSNSQVVVPPDASAEIQRSYDNIVTKAAEYAMREVANGNMPQYNGGNVGIQLPAPNMEGVRSQAEVDDIFFRTVVPDLAKQFAYGVVKYGADPRSMEYRQKWENVVNEAHQRFRMLGEYNILKNKLLDAQKGGQGQLSPEELMQAYKLGLIVPEVDAQGKPTGNYSLAPDVTLTSQKSVSGRVDADKSIFNPEIAFAVQPNREQEIRQYIEHQLKYSDKDSSAMHSYSPLFHVPYFTIKSPPLVMPSLQMSTQGSLTMHQQPLRQVPTATATPRSPSSLGGTQKTLDMAPVSVNPVWANNSVTYSGIVNPYEGWVNRMGSDSSGGLQWLPTLIHRFDPNTRKQVGVPLLETLFGFSKDEAQKIIGNGFDGKALLGSVKLKSVMPALNNPDAIDMYGINEDSYGQALANFMRFASSMLAQGPPPKEQANKWAGQQYAMYELAKLITEAMGENPSSPGAIGKAAATFAADPAKANSVIQGSPVLRSVLVKGAQAFAQALRDGAKGSWTDEVVTIGNKKYRKSQLALMFANATKFLSSAAQVNLLAALKYGQDGVLGLPDFSGGLSVAGTKYQPGMPYDSVVRRAAEVTMEKAGGKKAKRNFQQAVDNIKVHPQNRVFPLAETVVGILTGAVEKEMPW